MTPTLLVAEHDNAGLKDATAKAVSAARALGAAVHVLVAGKDCRRAAEDAARLEGVARVLLADHAIYEHQLAEPTAALIVLLADTYGTVMAAATAAAKSCMPRVAAQLDVMQISEIVKVISPDTFERLTYAGNAVQTVRSRDTKKIITVRTSAFPAVARGGGAPIEDIAPASDPGLSCFVGEQLSASERPELTSAKIVISGGRGMQSAERFGVSRAHCRQARRRHRRVARGGGRRLRTERLAGRPDREGRGA